MKKIPNNLMKMCKIIVSIILVVVAITPIFLANAQDSKEPIYANEFLDAKKQIDYLGDGVANPDTTVTGTDKYRLNLDVVGTSIFPAMDVVLVLDNSGSMSMYNLGNQQRVKALAEVLKGKSGQKGIIDEIFTLNDKNRISLEQFNGWGRSLTSWQGKESVNNLKNKIPLSTPSTWDANNRGTNTEMGLWYAQEQLREKNGRDNGHEKIVILLSDGEPTHYMVPNYFSRWEYNTFDGEGGYRLGDGTLSGSNKRASAQPTLNAANIFKRNHPEMSLYSIFVADAGDWNSNRGLMDKIASTPAYSYSAQNYQALIDSFRKSIGIMEDVTITDELSDFVDFYNHQPDVKVTKTSPTGVVTTLNSTEYVLSTPDAANPKKVAATIKGGLEIDYTYTLSFNVELTQQAYEAVDSTQTGILYYGPAGRLGDKNTDYLTNTTSSNQPGLPSNKKATVTWNRENKQGGTDNYEFIYDHPVVQVPYENIDAIGTISKKIDYLGDGIPNEDTNLRGGGDYRLQLQVKSNSPEGGKATNLLENIRIEDEFTLAVDFYEPRADLKIRRIVEGQTTDLLPTDYEFSYDEMTGKMLISFKDPLPADGIYDVSFNVYLTQWAISTVLQNNAQGLDTYNNQSGDDDTDYNLNTTSSNQSGFHSNELAQAFWTIGGENFEQTYKHPVVQYRAQ